MYVNPVVVGVLGTLFVECAILIAYALWINWRKK